MKFTKILFSSIFAIVLVFVVLSYNDYKNTKEDTYVDVIVRARKHYAVGFINKALDDSAKAIVLEPQKMEPYFIKIRCLIEMKDFNKAKQSLDALMELCKTTDEEDAYDNILNEYSAQKELFESYQEKYDNAKLLKSFLDSMYKNDVKIVNNTVFYNSFGVRGVCATDDIAPETIIIEVPKRMLIIASEARKWLIDKYSKDDKKDPQEIKNILNELYKKKTFAIGLYILENLEDPKFKPFIDIILSNDYTSFPLNFDEKTLKIIEQTDLEKNLDILKAALQHDYDTLYKIASVKKKYNVETLRKIYMTVSSRTFGVNFGKSNDMLLSPYSDMLNSGANINTLWYYDEQKNSFCLNTTCHIKAGEELIIVYDNYKSNSKLLLNYGFCNDNNFDNNEVILQRGIYQKDGTGVKFLGNKNYMCRKNTTNIHNDFPTLVTEVIDDIMNGSNDKKTLLNATKEAMNTICKLAKNKLDSYPETLERTKYILESKWDSLSFNERNCYLVCYGEKNILQWIIDFAAYCKQMLEQCKTIDDIKTYTDDPEINLDVKRFFTESKYFKSQSK